MSNQQRVMCDGCATDITTSTGTLHLFTVYGAVDFCTSDCLGSYIETLLETDAVVRVSKQQEAANDER